MALKTLKKEYPEFGIEIEYTLELYRMPKNAFDTLTITGRVAPSWVNFSPKDEMEFKKHESEIADLLETCDTFVYRNHEELKMKRIFGINMSFPIEDRESEGD